MTIGNSLPRALQNELAAGETALWFGRSVRPRIAPFIFSIFQILLFICFLLVSTKLGFADVSTGRSVTLLGETFFLDNSPFLMTPMIYFVWVCLALSVFGPVFLVGQSFLSLYAVTDQRVLIKPILPGGVTSIPFQRITSVDRFGRRRGSVVFREEPRGFSEGPSSRFFGSRYEFFAIRDPKTVEEIVRKQINKTQRTGR